MSDSEKLNILLKLVETQSENTKDIPQLKTDIALLTQSMTGINKRLSTIPTKNEVELHVIEYCEKRHDKLSKIVLRRFGWPAATAIIVGLLTVAAACVAIW